MQRLPSGALQVGVRLGLPLLTKGAGIKGVSELHQIHAYGYGSVEKLTNNTR